jgi:hypothetical protein
MALTQEQKNTISEVSQNPIKVLEDFQKKPYYLKSFKNEFFQDGTGLLHKILYQYFLTGNDNFFQLYSYVINNSNLTIFDYKGHKFSAISYIDNLKDSFSDYPNKLFKILETTNISNFHIRHFSYIIEKNIVDLYDINMKEKAFYNISKYKDNLNNYKDILKTIVKKDDIVFLTNLLKIISFDKFKNIDFNKDLSKNALFKNILYFSLENKSYEIANFLLQSYPELTSNSNNSLYSVDKKFSPILEVAKDSPLLDKIILNMDDKTLTQNLNHFSLNSEKILTYILNYKYNSFIEEKVIKLLNSNIDSYEKTYLLKSIFDSQISYDKKLFLLTSIIDENVKNINSNIDLFTSFKVYNAFKFSIFESFIFSIQKNPVISQTLFDKFIHEFNLRNLISKDQVFNFSYFSNIEYFKLVNNNNLLNKNNPLNFIEGFLIPNHPKNFSDDTDYIWYKISKLDFKNLKSNTNSFKALHLLLINNLDKYVNFFNSEKLSYLLGKNLLLSSYVKNEDSSDFFEIINKLIDSNFSFKKDINNFLKLLSFNPPYELLDKIIEKENIDLKQLSMDSHFWNNINKQKTFDYCIKHNASIDNPNYIFSLVHNYDISPLILFLENKGNVNYESNEGNILHHLCQYKETFKNKQILLLLDFVPHLAIQTNKQNKFPVFYLLSDFNKLCKKSKDNFNILSYQQKENLYQYYNIIKRMFECGLHSDNKKAFNILENQLLKYNDIIELFPDLLPTLRAGKLLKKLENKEIKTKPLKI